MHPLSVSVSAMEHFVRRQELDQAVGGAGCRWNVNAGELATRLCQEVRASGVCSPVSEAPRVTLANTLNASTAPIVVKSEDGSKEFKCLHVKEAVARLE